MNLPSMDDIHSGHCRQNLPSTSAKSGRSGVRGWPHWVSRSDRLAKTAGLSRTTISQLESATLVDLGVTKLARLLELMGLAFEAQPRATPHRGRLVASPTASVSYRSPLDAGQLA